MASGEKKLTILNSYIGSLPDDALLYVVVGGVSYKITKSALLEGISGGTTPNFQQVTDGEGNNITTNPLILDNSVGDIGVKGFYGSYEIGYFFNDAGDVYIKVSNGSSESVIYEFNKTLGSQGIAFGNVVYYEDKITVDGIDYPLPTGSSSPLATMANIPTINENYKGTYTSLSALETAHPTAALGNYAVVDAGAGNDAVQYIWDAQDGWVSAGSSSIATTDALTEGSTNLYFTVARVLASALSGLSLSDGSDVTSANTVLQAFGKLQKQLTDVRATKADKRSWMSQSTPRTLENTPVLQKIFNVGTSGNGSLPVVAGKRYKCTGWVVLSALSGSSKTLSFGVLGTATASYVSGTVFGNLALAVAAGQVSNISSFSATQVTSSATATSARVFFQFEFICSGSGSIIPSILTSVSTTGMQVDSAFFDRVEIGESSNNASSDSI